MAMGLSYDDSLMILKYIDTLTTRTYLDIGVNLDLYEFFYGIGNKKYMVAGYSFISNTSYNMSFKFNETNMYIRIDPLKTMFAISLVLNVPQDESDCIVRYTNLHRILKIKKLIN